jgi:hypothetical protein
MEGRDIHACPERPFLPLNLLGRDSVVGYARASAFSSSESAATTLFTSAISFGLSRTDNLSSVGESGRLTRSDEPKEIPGRAQFADGRPNFDEWPERLHLGPNPNVLTSRPT